MKTGNCEIGDKTTPPLRRHPSTGGEKVFVNQGKFPSEEGWHKFPQKFVTGWFD
ncbi:MAG: hypothetical protein FWF82_02455 [Oscillospiraceae bacterium]|nr:hypothetical protein [Oscillospiraceae bacterium]